MFNLFHCTNNNSLISWMFSWRLSFGKYSSVFWAPIWPVHIFARFLSDHHSHTSHTTHIIWTKVFKVKDTIFEIFSNTLADVYFASFGFVIQSWGIFKLSEEQTKNEEKSFQPIILFLVQSIGKYQIPCDLTVILLQGIKTWTQKGRRWKKSWHNSVLGNWCEF